LQPLLPKQVAKVRAELKTIGTADLKHSCYDVGAAWMTNTAFYLNCIVWSSSIATSHILCFIRHCKAGVGNMVPLAC